MRDYKEGIENYLKLEQETIARLDVEKIDAAMNAIMDARDRGAQIYTMGNGGSSATASHMVCDFAKGLYEGIGGKKFQFQCLSDNTPIMTAIANDFDYSEVFVRQLEGRLTSEDLILCISGSGNSSNVVKAAEYAKSIGTTVVSMTGYDGGMLMKISDYSMHVPINDMQIAEDVHMIFDHMMCRVLCMVSKDRAI